MNSKIRAEAVVIATSLVALPLALTGTALAQDEDRPTSYIGGAVFRDLNGDGVRQDDEPGMVNAEVMVKDLEGQSSPFLSDNNGNWFVKRVPAGEWEISYTHPYIVNTTPASVKVVVEDDNGYTVNFGVRVKSKDEIAGGEAPQGAAPKQAQQVDQVQQVDQAEQAVTPVAKTTSLAETGVDPVAAGAVGLGGLALGGLVFYAARGRRRA
ncbi:SdrD B-like domain-containing protein [Lentzea sp. NPDC051213]|uniref:SdrD B-like domain-containing protein n=1 Tax=Lentzea sp. NPDC051213 TaxID=3364126 RepID=UPI0037918C46